MCAYGWDKWVWPFKPGIKSLWLRLSSLLRFGTDYSNAFNTINQQKLLHILHDLCFPNVAIDSIKDIYAEATTRVQTPAGLTAAIQVGRGVLQGETLSPFLFNCFMEPLARWLQVGGRAYEYGCLKMARAGLQTQMRCRTPCSSYADDSQIFCNTIPDVCLQADKIHKYATWGNLKLQPAKCATTGMPHADIASGSVSSPLAYVGCEQLKNRLACVKIGPHQIPFAHPDKEAQKVSGVWITPTLNWKMQQRKLVDAAKDKSTAIVECDASPKQKLAMIRTCLKAYITYSFPLGIQSKDDIADLDGIVARTAKRALRLPLSTPTWLVLQENEACGAGVESLLVDYVQLGTAYLVRALNDQGKLGIVTKAMLNAQAKQLGRVPTCQIGRYHSSYRLMRQLEMIKAAGLKVHAPANASDKRDAYEELLSRKEDEDPLMFLDIASLMSHIKIDPKLIGEKKAVPLALFHPLAELGIHSLQDILCKNKRAKPMLIDTLELKRRFGALKVTHKHQIALNRLTLFVHGGMIQAEILPDAAGHNSCKSLPAPLRSVDPALLEADATRHNRATCPDHRRPGNPRAATQQHN